MAILATAVWRVRPSGSNTNGGGYDPGIAGAATDYSQQNAAQATGTLGTSTASTTFTDAGGVFTAAMVGNALWIASGAGFTVGAYFITAFTNSTTITLDRASGTGTVAHWAIGGAWADYWTNINTPIDGNKIFVLGSGTPNPSAYTYDYDGTTATTPSSTNVNIVIANDPATPGYKAPPDTTGGMPVTKFDVAGSIILSASDNIQVSGLWFVGTTTAATNYVFNANAPNVSNQGTVTLFGCVLDQFGFDVGLLTLTGSFGGIMVGCEVFTSVAPGAAGGEGAVRITGAAGAGVMLRVDGCNFHDTVGYGVFISATGSCVPVIVNSIIAKCRVDGIKNNSTSSYMIKGCTIDGNLGSGISLSSGANTYGAFIINNIISNHTQASTYGINDGAALEVAFIDYNVYYNNTSDLSTLSYGPHDTHGGSNPYVGQATENYTLA